MEDFRNRRKNYYIKKEFQRNFIIRFCLLVLAGSAISAFIIYMMSRATVTTTFENSRLIIKSTADFILPTVLISTGAVIVLVGIATIFITMRTSHKIAGPLYRMEKDVEEVAAGNLKKRFNLRVDDELKPLAAGLDGMVRELNNRVAEIKKAVADLEGSAGDNGAVREKIGKIKDETEKLKT